MASRLVFLLFFAFAFVVCAPPAHDEKVYKNASRGRSTHLELKRVQLENSDEDNPDSSVILPSTGYIARKYPEQGITVSIRSDEQLIPRGNALSCLKGGLCGANAVHADKVLSDSVGTNAGSTGVEKALYNKQLADFAGIIAPADAKMFAYKQNQEQEIRKGLQAFLENEAMKLRKIHHSKPSDFRAYKKKMSKEFDTLRTLLKFRLANKDMNETIIQILSRKGMKRVLQELQLPRQALVPFLAWLRHRELSLWQQHIMVCSQGARVVSAMEGVRRKDQWTKMMIDRQAGVPAAMGHRTFDVTKLANVNKRLAELERTRAEHEDAARSSMKEISKTAQVYVNLELASSMTKRLVGKARRNQHLNDVLSKQHLG